MILSNAKDIRRKSAKLANCAQNSGAILWLPPLKKSFLAPRVWEISHVFV